MDWFLPLLPNRAFRQRTKGMTRARRFTYVAIRFAAALVGLLLIIQFGDSDASTTPLVHGRRIAGVSKFGWSAVLTAINLSVLSGSRRDGDPRFSKRQMTPA